MSRDEKKNKDTPQAEFYDNWESATLGRVASRVEALGADADAIASRRLAASADGSVPESEDFGWEEQVVRGLRKRRGQA
jgi:hypothetical protein